MAKGLTAEQEADKMIRNAANATKDYEDGVRRVKVAPTQLAADKIDKMRANFNKSIDDGYTESRLRETTLQDYQKGCLGVGKDRYAPGMQSNREKIVASRRDLKTFRDQVTDEVNAMPDNTEADRDAKVLAQIRGMRQYKKRNRRS